MSTRRAASQTSSMKEAKEKGSSPSIKRLLIANRGEIACRIIRTCKERGITAIAVCSEADRFARHARLADEVALIGEAESSRSYLNPEAILAAAAQHNADAIHPGYGFLSENADFAARVEQAGITFIGPSPAAMRRIGDKLSAKEVASKAKVPMAPSVSVAAGASGLSAARAFIKKEGLPVIVKAAGGGGGRGMRKVHEESAIEDALTSASREAAAFFKDGRVFCEKLIQGARHIEVQILGDQHGDVVHLFDRDCTMQRNHQKVLEEAPAPGLSDELRERIQSAAVRLMKEAGYSNAGTVEFLLAPDGNFYFLEVNSRLQVEHPVTEAILGLDLVALQIGIAEGHSLRTLLPKGVPKPCGAAIEARLCAEIPEENFVASTGRLISMSFGSHHRGSPTPSVRIDTGFEVGDSVSHYYDSLLAKVIVHGASREAALDALATVLSKTQVEGVRVNRGFLLTLVRHPVFANVRHEINFAATVAPSKDQYSSALGRAALAALANEIFSEAMNPEDPWSTARGFRASGQVFVSREFLSGVLHLHAAGIVMGSNALEVKALTIREARSTGTPLDLVPGGLRLTVDVSSTERALTIRTRNESFTVSVSDRGDEVWVHLPEGSFPLTKYRPPLRQADASQQHHTGRIVSHLPGKVLDVKVSPGTPVSADTVLLVIESMKMEHRIEASLKGTVRAVHVQVGTVVQAGQTLAEIEGGEA